MDKKTILSIVIITVVVIIGLFLFLGMNGEMLCTYDSSINIPSSYTIDDNGIAYSGDVAIIFITCTNSKEYFDQFFDALKVNGDAAGYKNITIEEINGYKLYQYSANTKELKNVSSTKWDEGDYISWHEYGPDTSIFRTINMNVTKFRQVAYLNKNTGFINQLFIVTNNTNVDLYSNELNDIVHSIEPLNT